jgi:hypothetical protein
MKKVIQYLPIIALIYAIGILQGCKKQVDDGYGAFGTNTKGEISGLAFGDDKQLPRAGMTLSITARKYKDCDKSLYEIQILHDSLGLLTDHITFLELPIGKTGKFSIKYDPNTVANYCDGDIKCIFGVVNGGDVVVGSYFIDNSATNYINIETYNTQTNELSGTFDVTFYARGTSEQSRQYYGNRVRFHN